MEKCVQHKLGMYLMYTQFIRSFVVFVFVIFHYTIEDIGRKHTEFKKLRINDNLKIQTGVTYPVLK